MEKVFSESGSKKQGNGCSGAEAAAGKSGAAGKACRSVTIVNPSGFQLRAAAEFVRVAGSFPCSVTVRDKDRTADGKSVVSLLCLGAHCGVTITIEAAGARAEEAVEKLSALVADGFPGRP